MSTFSCFVSLSVIRAALETVAMGPKRPLVHLRIRLHPSSDGDRIEWHRNCRNKTKKKYMGKKLGEA